MKVWSQLLLSFLGATADWVLRQPPCDLTSTATGFYKRKYALAVANQSPLRDKINEALIELQFSNKFEVGVESRTSQRGTPIPNRDCGPPTYYSARSPPPKKICLRRSATVSRWQTKFKRNTLRLCGTIYRSGTVNSKSFVSKDFL